MSEAYRPGDLCGRFRLVKPLDREDPYVHTWAAARAEDFPQQAEIRILAPQAPLEAAERFQAVRQALALLEHRAIVRLMDGGITGRGDPYMVLEPAAGRTIEEAAAGPGWDTASAVSCVAQILDALEYGHQRLQLHGSFQPGGVLIQSGGEPKLVRFGVRAGDCFSPTTASDIHAAGELLSRLVPRPAGDLQAVLRKALNPEPDARYASAADFAADLRRFLERRPVRARPAGLFYTAARFVSRAPLLAGVAILVAVLLVCGAGVIVAQSVRAERARIRAEQRLRQLQVLTGELESGLAGAVRPLPQSGALLDSLSSWSEETLGRLAALAEGDPKFASDLARSFLRLAEAQRGRGNLAAAREAARRGLPLARAGGAPARNTLEALRRFEAETGPD